MTDSYVGDGTTLPTTPAEALDLISGFIDGCSTADIETERPDIDAAFGILTRLASEQHYLIVCAGMVDPSIVAGPFASDDEATAAVPGIVASDDHDLGGDESEDVLFWLDIVDGKPEVGSYSGGFMDEMREKADAS